MNTTPKDRPGGRAAWIKKPNARFEKLLSNSYRKDQLIVYYQKTPSEKDIRMIKESFEKRGFNTREIKIRSCDNCDIPVQLWSAKGIHTLISTDSVSAGSGPVANTVGESYSLNFLNTVPAGKLGRLQTPSRPDTGNAKKDQVVIAVLDTGIDPLLVNPDYIWKDTVKKGGECFKDVDSGWNFVDHTGNFKDDHPGRHGSLVSQYIINEFKHSRENGIRIMPLKTHDKDGAGDLFGIICAIHFAIAKGAHIINASWGFYYYYQKPIPYLQQLITVELKRRGILFVTATGNQVEAEDEIARQIWQAEYGAVLSDDDLRNLEIHNFYPANLSAADNSILSVTTTDGKTVSSTQNYSEQFTDLGVMADMNLREGMKFKIPFDNVSTTELISGSSFATAIASGIIGARCSKSLYVPGIEKSAFLLALAGAPVGAGTVLVKKSPLAKKYIKDGACLNRQ